MRLDSDRVPASQVEPGWEVWREGEWVRVDMVVETETPEGDRRLWFYSAGHKAKIVIKTDLIKARPR